MLQLVAAVVLLADGGDPVAQYDLSTAALEKTRMELVKRSGRDARAKARGEARTALLHHVDDAAFPAWTGTPWDFYGASETPRQGQIACGYFVTTVLSQAGFRVERVRLAQQASAYIVSTMARGSRVLWLRHLEGADVVQQVRDAFGDGLYIVGLDLHVGFLRLDGRREDFCHASYLAPGTVLCEPAATAAAFASNLYVVGDALTTAALDDWLEQREIATQLPPRRR